MNRATEGAAMILHVSRGGSDAWSGRLPEANAARTDGPLATPARARDVIRALKASAGLPAGGVAVTVRGGEYGLSEPLAFTAADSGSPEAPVLYRAAAGETVRLSGGARIAVWAPVTDPAVLARLPPEARGRVVQADLRAHGVTDFDALTSAEGVGAKGTAKSDPGLEVFFRDQPMILARYPNEGFLRIATLSAEDGHHIREYRGSRVGRFRVEGECERLRRWAAEPNIVLHGYWFWDWADQRMAVKGIEPETGEITLDDRHAHCYGYRAGQWFYAFNLLCELDQPGEWYLDRDAGILYFWPPEPLHDGDVTVSVLRDPVTFADASHVTLQGFTIEAVRGTGIQVRGGEAVRIAGCTLRNVGGDAIRVTGGARHAVVDCDIYQTGDGGIQFEGGDRRTLTPGGHEALNNHIHHIARWNALYKVGIQLKGCGHRAAHNRIHDVPHVAIGFTDNDQTVEYNEIYQSVTGANDAGAIYTSGSHPEDWTMRGHRIRFNYLHHLSGFAGEGCNGIYLDDMFSGTEIHGNLLWRVAQGFLLGGGRDIVATNNILIDCPRAISLDARALGWAAPYMPLDQLDTMPYREEPWASRYPELVGIREDEPAVPKGNVIARNIVCGGDIWVEDGARPGLCMADNLEQAEPRFADAERADWRLREDSPALRLGFEPLPLEQIGLQISPLRRSLPPRRLFEAEAAVESPPLLRNGTAVRAGALRVRVRNVGDGTDTCSIRLRVRGGHPEDAAPFVCTLAPFATAEKRYALWAGAGTVHVEVACDGVGGVLATCAVKASDEAVTPWPAALNVSALQPGAGRLETLERIPPADALQWRPHPADSTTGFCDLHARLEKVGAEDAVVWFACRVRCPEAMRAAVLLGYDGPVRLFVDGRPVFHDPAGTNPARPDMSAPEVALAAGDHDVAVALGACQGRAWGVYLRLLRLDCGVAGMPVLPEITAQGETDT